MHLNRATTWILALAVLLFALLAGTASYHMLLGPGYGGMPFWGRGGGRACRPGMRAAAGAAATWAGARCAGMAAMGDTAATA